MSWALLVKTAVPECGGAVIAASDDLLSLIKDDGHIDYVTIFPEVPGIYLWTGSVAASSDGIVFDGDARRMHMPDSELTHIINKNGAPLL